MAYQSSIMKEIIIAAETIRSLLSISAVGFPFFLAWKTKRQIRTSGSEAVNSFASLIFAFLPLQFLLKTDPYKWNYKLIAADVLAKCILLPCLALCAMFSRQDSFDMFIAGFSLIVHTNALLIGEPLLTAMYNNDSRVSDLVVQLAVVQIILWVPLYSFLLEVRAELSNISTADEETQGVQLTNQVQGFVTHDQSHDGNVHRYRMQFPNEPTTVDVTTRSDTAGEGTEAGNNIDDTGRSVPPTADLESGSRPGAVTRRRPCCSRMMKAGWKAVLNPNFLLVIIGLAWAFIAPRFTNDSKTYPFF